MTLQELLAAARKAVAEGKLDEAEKLTAQAKALKAVDDLAPPAEEKSEELDAVKAKLADYDKKWAKLEAEPANNKAAHLVVTEDETDKKAAMPWPTLGEFLKQVYVAAAHPYKIDDRLKAQKAILGASEGVPSDGGWLVQQGMSDQLFMLEHAPSELTRRVRRFPVGANNNGLKINAIDETSRVTGSRWGGVNAYWAAEGDTASATKPKFRQIELELNKLMAFFYATDEMLEDTNQLEAVANQAVREELDWLVENAIVRGTGAGQPEGILNSGALVTVAKESGQGAATIVFENIIKMWSRRWARSTQNLIWLINQDVEPQLYSMSLAIGTGGVPVYLPPGGLSTSGYGTLMGRPVIPVEQASTLGTVGDIMLVDPTQYLAIDKGGVKQAASMHVAFLTDQMCYRWTYRVDGKSGWRSALTPANGTKTQSPFIVLATRA